MASGGMVKSTVTEDIHSPTKTTTTDNLQMVIDSEKENTSGLMEAFTKDNGSAIK
jgi:hypothetical protein